MSRTNFQKIKDLNIEEMAEFLDEVANAGYNCSGVVDEFSDYTDECYSTLEWLNYEITNKFKEWLEREVEE